VPPPVHRIAVQNPSRSRRLPDAARIEGWASHALGPAGGRGAVRDAEVTVRFVSRTEAVALNARFRGRDYAPNVLAFPYDAEDGDPRVHGDIAICPAIVAREALAQGKRFDAHLAHLVVHGVLHLRGHDHVEDRAAARMERLESKLVAALGFDDPWAAEHPRRATIRSGIPPSPA
jgi:probable rRNA maturation factor